MSELALDSPENGAHGAHEEDRFANVIDALCAANEDFAPRSGRRAALRRLPSRFAIARLLDDLRAVLYPAHFGSSDPSRGSLRYYLGARLDQAARTLAAEVRAGLAFACAHEPDDPNSCPACERRAREVTDVLVGSLPRLREALDADLRAAYHGDPAARFLDETLLCYPGVTALTQHRIAHELYALGVPLVPRIVSELAHGTTGIDIHPGARIGSSFFIDHGTGVVIGETCTIGERVRIYQGVTLGARGFPTDEDGHPVKGVDRHPVVEDDVVIYAGATILGRVTIGRGATIGGNVWLTRDVAPHEQVSQAQARREKFGGGAGI
ncbi:MAG TPA: serine O-acetyltransferase EpsC [Polyangiaceae bacterium]|nr:serine O-acetyltransferase EpsC [Polyangiaceae bacterium]